MRSKTISILLFCGLGMLSKSMQAQVNNVQVFGFVNSLTDHDFEVVTDVNYTDVNYWVNNIVQSSNNVYGWTGQFGQPENHVANLPPFAQLGSLNTPTSWDSEGGATFANSGINTIIINTANFTQGSPPDEPIAPGFIDESALELIEDLFDYCNDEIPDLRYYIQSGWQEIIADSYPPSQAQIDAFHNGLLGTSIDYDAWFVDLQDLIVASRPELNPRLIPQRSIVSGIYTEVLNNQVPFTEAYEDNAPHGTPSTYFLVGLINYMALFEQEVPSSYTPSPSSAIHPAIIENRSAIYEYIWQELNAFNFQNGESRVFYSTVSEVNAPSMGLEHFTIVPNPAEDFFTLQIPVKETFTLSIIDLNGKVLKIIEDVKALDDVDVSAINSGLYFVRLSTKDHQHFTQKIIIR